MEKKLIYETDKECPLCEQAFKVTRTRVGLRMVSMDTDFRMKYEGVDPYLYVVWVCPHCGYAAPDSAFAPLSDNEKAILQKALQGKKVGIKLEGERTVEQALVSYKLAIYFGELRHIPPSQLAGLYLKMAWLSADKGDKDLQQACLTKAVEHYMEAYSTERFPIGKMTENTLGYLIANLLDRLGKYEEAAKWLGKVVNKKNSGEAKIQEMARDLWQSLKGKRAQAAGAVQ